MTLIPLWVLLYGMMMGVTFRVIANTTLHPEDPWDTPGPFFGSLLWPLALPTMIGIKGATLVLGDGTARTSRDERRRKKELAEAKHKLHVAQIEAATTRELERALEK